jgi:hypothetical protein
MHGDYVKLLNLTLQIDREFASVVQDDLDGSMGAQYAAQDAYGIDAIINNPLLVNVAALAILQRKSVGFKLDSTTIDGIQKTIIFDEPTGPPQLLQQPLILDSDMPLFENTTSLGMYPYREGYVLIGVLGDEMMRAYWQPRWVDKPGTMEQGYWHLFYGLEAWAREAARFALTLGIILDTGAKVHIERNTETFGTGRASRKVSYEIKTVMISPGKIMAHGKTWKYVL